MSTSVLQRVTSSRFFRKYGKYGLIENSRPAWLISSKGERLELDFYIEKAKIAIEVQGDQHYNFTPIFHDTEYDFEEQLRRDKEKLNICTRAGIKLLYIRNKGDIDVSVYEIDSIINNQINSESRLWWDTDNDRIIGQRRKSSKRICRKEWLKLSKSQKRNRRRKNHKSGDKPNQRKRLRARKRNLHTISDSLWIVWGGTGGLHTVELVEGKLVCDCGGYEISGNRCIHCVAVELLLDGKPFRNYVDNIENL